MDRTTLAIITFFSSPITLSTDSYSLTTSLFIKRERLTIFPHHTHHGISPNHRLWRQLEIPGCFGQFVPASVWTGAEI